jgi:hypothetical protein
VLQVRLLQALDRLGASTAETQALVRQLLGGAGDAELRQLASRLRVRIGGAGEDRLSGLRDVDAGVRLATLTALLTPAEAGRESGLSSAAGDVAQIDAVLLQDSWPKVRRAAVEARAALCREPAGAGGPVQALRKALGDADGDVQRRALVALGRCEGAGAVELFAQLAEKTDASAGLRGQACGLVARYGFRAPVLSAAQRGKAHAAAATALLDLLHEPTADDRHAAALAQCLRGYSDSGDVSDLPTLIEVAGKESPSVVRQGAVGAMAAICTRRTAEGRSPAGAAPTAAIDGKVRQALEGLLRGTAAAEGDARLQSSAQRAAQACGIRLTP